MLIVYAVVLVFYLAVLFQPRRIVRHGVYGFGFFGVLLGLIGVGLMGVDQRDAQMLGLTIAGLFTLWAVAAAPFVLLGPGVERRDRP